MHAQSAKVSSCFYILRLSTEDSHKPRSPIPRLFFCCLPPSQRASSPFFLFNNFGVRLLALLGDLGTMQFLRHKFTSIEMLLKIVVPFIQGNPQSATCPGILCGGYKKGNAEIDCNIFQSSVSNSWKIYMEPDGNIPMARGALFGYLHRRIINICRQSLHLCSLRRNPWPVLAESRFRNTVQRYQKATIATPTLSHRRNN